MVSRVSFAFIVCCAFGIGVVGMLTVLLMSPVLPPFVSTWLRGRSGFEMSAWRALINATQGATPAAGTKYNKLLFVAYLSAPLNVARRDQVRKNCFPAIRAAGYEVKFFIGRPNEEGPVLKTQGQRATEFEAQTAVRLQTEANEYGDIVIVPFRDAYRDLTDKVVFLFRYALQAGVENILKIDDDWCPNLWKVVSACQTTRPHQARYIGQHLWRGDEFNIMKGRDGSVSKFMSGIGFILSSGLARAIFYDDLVHTLLFAPYGTSSDDANVGRWYNYAAERHPELQFSREVVYGLLREAKES